MRSKIIVGLISVLLLTGCISYEAQEEYEEFSEEFNIDSTIKDGIKSCKKAGGIPILSVFDNRLADCIFPPKEGDKSGI